jgi:RimJ/RimL family protein N-acetyltransferase
MESGPPEAGVDTPVRPPEPDELPVTASALRSLSTLLGSSREAILAGADSLGLDSLTILELGERLEAEGWTGAFERLHTASTVAEALDALSRSTAPARQPETGPAVLTVPPSMRGRRVALTPVVPGDHDFLYALAVSEGTGFRWRFRGSTPSYEAFQSVLWQGLTAQFLIRDPTGTPIGHAIIYNTDFNLGLTYVGVVVESSVHGSGLGVEAARLLVHYAFCTWALRICYMELPEYNYFQFASGEGRSFEVEGRLRGAEVYGGKYYDRLILAISRDLFYRDEKIRRAPGL